MSPHRAALGVLLLAGCHPREPELPAGALLAGDSAAAGRLLQQLSGWEGTRVAGWASSRAEQIGGCAEQFTWISDGNERLDCEPLSALSRWSAGHPLVFALPAGPPGRLVGWIDPGATTTLGADLLNPEEVGIWGLLLPDERSPGPFVLSDERALVHGRIRAARVAALASLVESGGQGDAMFGLKSELFTNSVLDGTWEFAIYVPSGDALLPEVALAVGVRSEELARAALDGYIGQVEETWSTAFTRGIPGLEGCFENVNMLPELAPCGAIADSTLVVGWNRHSLEHARSAAAGTPVEGGLVQVDMGLFPEADRLLSLAFAPNEPAPVVPYPWSKLTLRLNRDDAGLHLALEAWPR